MGREHNSSRSVQGKSNLSQQFLLLLIVFGLGYFAALYFDIDTVKNWVNQQILAQQEKPSSTVVSKEQHVTKPVKPKFEFYTLLTQNKNSNGNASHSNESNHSNTANTVAQAAKIQLSKQAPEKAVVVEAKPTHNLDPIGHYLVQVAAFKASRDAEQMKGTLILKGFNVKVMPFNHASRGTWFRVLVGPFYNRDIAFKAQSDLLRTEHLKGVVIRG